MGRWYHYLGNAFWGFEFVFSVHEIVMDRLFDGSLVAGFLGFAPIAQSIFVPLAVVGFFFLIYHNIVWFSRRTKRYKFYELRSYVHAIQSSTRETKQGNMAIFVKKLEAFKVDAPPITEYRIWANWFPEITALIETKSLKEAREFDIDKFMEGKP